LKPPAGKSRTRKRFKLGKKKVRGKKTQKIVSRITGKKEKLMGVGESGDIGGGPAELEKGEEKKTPKKKKTPG